MFGTSLGSRVSTAYESLDRSRFALRETNRVLVIVLSALVNGVFIFSGIARPLGLYTLVVHCLVVYILVSSLEHCGSPARCELEVDKRPDLHTHSLNYSSTLQTSVVVWLAWFVLAHLFFEADLLFAHSRLLLLLLFITSAATTVASYRPQWKVCEILATHAFVVVYIICLAFPSTRWVPQTAPSASTLIRVALFFLTSSVIDIIARYEAVSESQVVTDADPESNSTRQFCLTMENANHLVVSDSQRTRRVMTQTAWLLITAGVDVIIYGLALIVIALLSHGRVYERLIEYRRERDRRAEASAAAPRSKVIVGKAVDKMSSSETRETPVQPTDVPITVKTFDWQSRD